MPSFTPVPYSAYRHVRSEPMHATQSARHKLLATEQETARRITVAYHQTSIHLAPHLHTFADAYDRAHTAAKAYEASDEGSGNPRRARVSLLWLTRRGPDGGNLPALKAAVHAEVTHFTAHAHAAVTRGQRQAAKQASQDAQAMLAALLSDLNDTSGDGNGGESESDDEDEGAPFPPPLTGEDDEDRIRGYFTALGSAAEAALIAAIFASLAAGRAASDLLGDMWDALGRVLSGALTIWRTALMDVWRNVVLGMWGTASDVVDGWIWRARAGACAFCSSMDGTFHTLDETLDSHLNCGCVPEPHRASKTSE